jgi:hypothetical protein
VKEFENKMQELLSGADPLAAITNQQGNLLQ